MLERLDDRANDDTNIAGLRENEHRTGIDEFRVALGGAHETRAFVDVAGDDDAPELSAKLVGDAALDDADYLDRDPLPEERMQA